PAVECISLQPADFKVRATVDTPKRAGQTTQRCDDRYDVVLALRRQHIARGRARSPRLKADQGVAGARIEITDALMRTKSSFFVLAMVVGVGCAHRSPERREPVHEARSASRADWIKLGER